MGAVIAFPRAMKRGRKATKGPKASVSVLYEPSRSQHAQPLSRDEKMKQLALRIGEKIVEEKRQWEAFLAASPNVIQYPATRRVRTVMEVNELRWEEP